ncbi:MAG TPA: hypothetical protein VFG59_02755 [Anaeromyxobacter sp.]|nr:hypothetical protein [Anaeromyxobacter sp.]
MDLWEIRRRRRVRVYGTERIRRKLARGRLHADSLVRPLGDSQWKPLGEVPVLLAPPTVENHGDGGRGAVLLGVVQHAAVWAAVSYFFNLPPVAVKFWGLAVGLHALSTVPKLFRRRTPGPPPLAGQAEAAAGPAREADPFLTELDTVLGDLERAASSRDLPGAVDIPALRSAAEELRRRHLSLLGLADPAAQARLAEERDRALSQAAAAKDPRTVEALREQARSVGERLDSLREAAETAARLEARERTLLHQLEALRLAVARSGADEARPPELAGEVQRLRLDLKAGAEVEEHLARARLLAEQGSRR